MTRQDAAINELEALGPPKTPAGIRAMTRASLACHEHKNYDREVVPECDGHWIALVVLEYAWLAA